MSRVPSKRAASSSPPASGRSALRRRLFAPNHLTDSAHEKQDSEVEARLDNHRRRQSLDLARLLDLATVVSCVVVVTQKHSAPYMKPVENAGEYAYILDEDAEMQDIVKEAVNAKSYKNVRNLRASL
jgi:hypothetical protein